jgi:hypothetical protein
MIRSGYTDRSPSDVNGRKRMWQKRRAKVAWAVLFLAAAATLYLTLVPGRSRGRSAAPIVASKAAPLSQPTQTSLVHEFIRWYELQFITRMRRVGSFSTDVQDLVTEMGLEKTLDRYIALREVNLEYVLRHPDCRNIPDADLEDLARRQFEHIVSSTRSSRRWIDYSSPKVTSGAIEPMKQTSLAWIPFYQKLLSAPAPDGRDFKERFKAHVSRDEYVQTMERVTRAKAAWHAAVKEGIVWYASWLSWARTMADNVGKQDIAGCWATVDDIYGAPNEAAREDARPPVSVDATSKQDMH